MILMKFNALFVIFERAAKFLNVVFCKIIGGALWVKEKVAEESASSGNFSAFLH